jgi:tetratricopeptide (TPR) repeat protein
VQSLIVSEVTAALSGLDGPVPLDVQNERVIRTLTSSEEIHPEAYEAYLSGRFLFSQRNPQALLEARRQFKQACELSPRFAPAHASLSRTCRFLTIFEMSDPGPMWEEAELYARRAVELDGLLSESQSSLACVLARYRWRWLEGCVAYEEALRLNPSDPETYCDYGVTLLAMGELNEGARCLERALRLDPRYAIARATVGMSRLMAGQQKEGIEMLTQMTEAMPDFLSGWIYLGIGALNAHEPSRAVTAFERTLAIAGEQPTLMSLLAQAYSMQGQSAAAAAAVSKVWEQVGRRYVSPTALAIAAIAVQDCAGALREIAKVVTERDANFALYRKMRLFDAVRHQPEFLQTLVTMGLRSAES